MPNRVSQKQLRSCGSPGKYRLKRNNDVSLTVRLSVPAGQPRPQQPCLNGNRNVFNLRTVLIIFDNEVVSSEVIEVGDVRVQAHLWCIKGGGEKSIL